MYYVIYYILYYIRLFDILKLVMLEKMHYQISNSILCILYTITGMHTLSVIFG